MATRDRANTMVRESTMENGDVSCKLIVIIDDMRVFTFMREYVGDTAAIIYLRALEEAMDFLAAVGNTLVDELWLDHDLTGDDTIQPVVDLMEKAAESGSPFNVKKVVICSDDLAGSARIHTALNPWYNVVDMPSDMSWRILE